MKLYRLMKVDDDGKPLVGSGAMMLGVRPADPTTPQKRFDVPAVVGTDAVQSGDGGLSCYDNPSAIRIQTSKAVLWSIEAASQPAGVPHYHIEPKVGATLDELQQLLANTRDLWKRE